MELHTKIFLNVDLFPFQASVYKTGTGSCAAFLANVRTNSDATVNFSGNSYHLPAWSVSILPDCKNVALNTAQVCLIVLCFMYNDLSRHSLHLFVQTVKTFLYSKHRP